MGVRVCAYIYNSMHEILIKSSLGLRPQLFSYKNINPPTHTSIHPSSIHEEKHTVFHVLRAHFCLIVYYVHARHPGRGVRLQRQQQNL